VGINPLNKGGDFILKKFFAALLVLSLFLFGVPAIAKTQPLNIQINGVNVLSDSNYVKGNQAMVDAKVFFQVLNQPYIVSNGKVKVKSNGKTVATKMYKGKRVANLNDLAKAVESVKVTYFKQENLYYVLALPKGVIQLTPAVPKMGEHWARPQDMPLGPIYGVYNGKLVFLEQMPSQEFFTKGKSIVNLDGMRGYPSPAINHTNIEFQPHGHEGYEVPHFDIHHYFISPQEQDRIGSEHAH
jgi:hypothetical protein